MPPRRSRTGRRLVWLGILAALVVIASLLAGVVSAAHRDADYRRTVDASFAAEASVLVDSSNQTGHVLAELAADPRALGRSLLEARLAYLDQTTTADREAADLLVVPPPDANAASRVIDALRLRADAVAEIRGALERLLGLTQFTPEGAAVDAAAPGRPLRVAGAAAILERASEQLVEADRIYRGLPHTFFVASAGARLPQSRWTQPATGRLMPTTLMAVAQAVAFDPSLAATIDLRIAAVETTPLPLPIGGGYPIPPSSRLLVAISVLNDGSASTAVLAVIRVTPTGRLGHYDAGRAMGTIAARGGVALTFPAMAIVPGEHCVVTIQLVRPARQTSVVGLRWTRTVVVSPGAPKAG